MDVWFGVWVLLLDWFVYMVEFFDGVVVCYDKLLLVMGLVLWCLLIFGFDVVGVYYLCSYNDVVVLNFVLV